MEELTKQKPNLCLEEETHLHFIAMNSCVKTNAPDAINDNDYEDSKIVYFMGRKAEFDY